MAYKAVYTVIMGDKSYWGSDSYALREDIHKSEDWDYICFTNNRKITSKAWKVVYLDEELDSRKLSRKVKILANHYLPDHEISLYVDTRFAVVWPLDKWMNDIDDELVIMRHNKRDCVYREATKLKQLGYNAKVIDAQIRRYREEGMPENWGLYAPGIMFRHHTEKVDKLMNEWWHEIEQGSYRDILSLAYVLWKSDDPPKMSALNFKSTYAAFFKGTEWKQ
jgi:hypothetical protein